MKAQSTRRRGASQELAATTSRNFRTFLLLSQFEAQEIGARIAQARREAGLGQDDLAEMASFSKRSLQDYETGVTIPYKHFAEISRLLKRTTEWFLYGDEEELNLTPDLLERLEVAVGALAGEAQRLAEIVERLDRRSPPGEAEQS